MSNKKELWELQSMQAAPLSVKISLTKARIREWVNTFGEDGVYISFSGGKDSTVLLHIVREEYPNIPAVFIDTGLEFPEIRQFVKTFDNVIWLKPKLTFRQVIEKYGYPFISKEVAECVYGARRYIESVIGGAPPTYKYFYEKLCGQGKYSKANEGGQTESTVSLEALRNLPPQIIDNIRVQRLLGILLRKGKATMESIPSKKDRSAFSCARYQFFLESPFEISNRCCNIMKKSPAKSFARKTGRHPITAQMASESRLRTQKWLKDGCNAFDIKDPVSNPMAFWTEQDVLLYIYTNNIPICSVYGDIVKEADVDGQLDLEDIYGKGLFDLGTPTLKVTGYKRTGCMFCGFGCHLEKPGEGRFERMKETHPKQYQWIMKPWEEGGLGYQKIIDWINEHGNLNIKY